MGAFPLYTFRLEPDGEILAFVALEALHLEVEVDRAEGRVAHRLRGGGGRRPAAPPAHRPRRGRAAGVVVARPVRGQRPEAALSLRGQADDAVGGHVYLLGRHDHSGAAAAGQRGHGQGGKEEGRRRPGGGGRRRRHGGGRRKRRRRPGGRPFRLFRRRRPDMAGVLARSAKPSRRRLAGGAGTCTPKHRSCFPIRPPPPCWSV